MTSSSSPSTPAAPPRWRTRGLAAASVAPRSTTTATAATATATAEPRVGRAAATRASTSGRDQFDAVGGRASAREVTAGRPAPGGLPPGPWSIRARPEGARAAAPDGSGPTALDAVRAAAPAPTGEALVRALSDAVVRCIDARPPADDDAIVDKLSSFVFTDSARDFVEAVRRGERPVLAEISSSVMCAPPADATRPHHFYMLTLNGRSSWGGMVRFHDDIFPEGFYRTRALDNVAPTMLAKAPCTGDRASLLFEQPYFRWEAGRYELKLGDAQDNAALRIVDHLAATSGERISLWRGTQPAWDSPEKLRALGEDGRYVAGSMSKFGDEVASVMTTPDRAAAEGWANPTLLRFTFTPDELRDLARAGLLYAGIEYEYLELALLYDRDPASARGRASVDRMTRV